MTLDEVVFAVFLVLLLVGMTRSSVFLIFAGLMALILAAVLDSSLLSAETPFVRYGTFMILISTAIVLFVRGALDLPKEAAR